MQYRMREHALDFWNCICIADGKKLEIPGEEKKKKKEKSTS